MNSLKGWLSGRPILFKKSNMKDITSVYSTYFFVFQSLSRAINVRAQYKGTDNEHWLENSLIEGFVSTSYFLIYPTLTSWSAWWTEIICLLTWVLCMILWHVGHILSPLLDWGLKNPGCFLWMCLALWASITSSPQY